MADRPPDKRTAIERLLPHGPVLLHLDPRVDGVEVPPELSGTVVLRLKVSPRFANPLSLDDDAVRQRLNFPDGPWSCVIPWEAVFGVGSDGDKPKWLWLADLPREMLAAAVSAASDKALGAAAPSRLRPLEPEEPEGPGDDPPEPPPPRGRPHLRLVKG